MGAKPLLKENTSLKTSRRSKKWKEKRQRKKEKVSSATVEINNIASGKDLQHVFDASMFRFINEKLYNCSSEEAVEFFNEDPAAFEIYHSGYAKQAAVWPEDPILWISKYLQSLPLTEKTVVVDMGCGNAKLAENLKDLCKVVSYDLVAANENVLVCDIAKTPLKNSSVDVVVYSLSLMGTNVRDFIYEANRILKKNGLVIIVEVSSRFDGKFDTFTEALYAMGFSIEKQESSKSSYFVKAVFKKTKSIESSPVKMFQQITLKPCLYKKR